MADPVLHVASGLELPVDAVTETFLIFGKRGSGKTTAASVLTEELIGAGLPVCVIDPMGAWWGLRSSADGQGPGLPVTILGGEHADLSLPPEAGAEVAGVVAAERVPVVLDLFLMSKTQQRRFVTDFMEHLYRRNREPLHLVVDESDRFAPQRGTQEMARLLGAYEDIVLRGRKPGIGSTSITLRPAQLHSAIRSQVEVLIAMRLLGKLDVAAIDEWIRLHASDEDARELKASLPSLPVGTAWVWSPGWLEIMTRIQVRPRRTFDSSATPKVGEQRTEPSAFARVDLERLSIRLQEAGTGGADPGARAAVAAPEVTRLGAEVRSLREQLAVAQARAPERVEVPVLAAGELAALEQAVAGLRDLAGSLELALSRAVQSAAIVQHQPARQPARRTRPAREPDSEQVTLGRAHRAILTVLAQFPGGRTRNQLATLSGYSVKSSGFANSLGALRSAGLVNRGEPIQATPEGVAALGGAYEPLPAGPALVEHWMSKLGKAERTLLRVFLEAWPESLTREQAAERSGYSATSSGLANALGRLRTLELIHGWTADATLAAQVGVRCLTGSPAPSTSSGAVP